jgi:DNA-binding NtrC family response regulator
MPTPGGPGPTIKKPRIAAPEGMPSTFELSVLTGADAGLVVSIDAGESRLLVGKSPVCRFRLTDPCVSRRHAAIDASTDSLRVLDLDSTNGTVVNGVRIREAILVGGETLYFGDTTIAVRKKGQRLVELPETTAIGRLVGESPAMRKLFPLVERVTNEAGPLLVEGEVGVGKELVAEEIHRRSARRDATFVVVACAEHAPSELAGALRDSLRAAAGGTLFIDELAELDAEAQRALLVAISTTTARVVGATTTDLDAAVEEGRFSEELFRAFSASRVEVPPLRERRGDVLLLARRYWVELGGEGKLPADFLVGLTRHRWPGNLNELRERVLQRIALGAEEERAPDDASFSRLADGAVPYSRARRAVLAAFDQRYVSSLLARHEGSVARAAAASGLALRYFQRIKARSF